MRTNLSARTLGGVLLLAWGCGGNVVVDELSTGNGGSSTESTTGDTTSSSTPSGSGFTCTLMCGGPVGLCGCAGPCSDGKARAIGCGGAAGSGFSCTCSVDGQVIGTCSQESLSCALPQSCCGLVFGE